MLSISPCVCNSRVTSIILVALTHTRGHSHMVYLSSICFYFTLLLIFIFILSFIFTDTFVRKVRTKTHHNMHQQTTKQAYHSIIWGLRWDLSLRVPSFSKRSAEKSAEWPGGLTHLEWVVEGSCLPTNQKALFTIWSFVVRSSLRCYK